jgi:nucleotide-binding universal stress UspA family protein
MNNILVAIDFEEKTKNLLINAKQIAEKFGSKIWIIHMIEHQLDYYGTPESFQYAVQYVNIRDIEAKKLQKEHKMVQDYSDQLIKEGIQSEGLLIEGPTVKVILDEAIKLKIDLIIIGSHKHSFLYDALLKSTTASIIKKSNIPIMVVPI